MKGVIWVTLSLALAYGMLKYVGGRKDPGKISAFEHWSRPVDEHELKSFLGLCTYYRRFVKIFSNIDRPLHKMTEGKQNFWTEECGTGFKNLMEALTSAPILIYPQSEKQFILDTDMSCENIDVVLSQEADDQKHVIPYLSKCLSKPKRNFCTTRKELLAFVEAMEHFHHY